MTPALWIWALTASSLLPFNSGDKMTLKNVSLLFTRPIYNASIPENSLGKTFVESDEKMGLFLPQVISKPDVQFKIVSGDPDKIFKADEKKVGNFLFLLIRTRTGNSVVLNRERKFSFVLEVKVVLSIDGRTIENSTIVNITVSDKNDLRPLFYQNSYQIDIKEDTRVHSSVIKIRADDADLGRGGEVYYRFKDPNSHFVIHPTTGVVTLNRPLRYSEKRSFEILLLAQDRGNSLHKNPPSTSKLNIKVSPVNFYNPEIIVENLERFYETSDTNIFAILTVTDKDIGKSGEIAALEIIDGDSNGHFRIKRISSNNNTSEFNIVTLKLLNRETTRKQYNLTLRAVDKGTPPRQTVISIKVNVEPVVQKVPIFGKEIYEIDILESAPLNSPVIRLKTTDGDLGVHDDIHFEIVGGNEENVFRINSQTGMLYTSNLLDAEEKNLYILTVSALEQGKSGFNMQSSAKVKINVFDINDNDPIFEYPSLNIFVTENEPPGTSIARVVAKDSDSGENGYISYSIANLNPVPFEIDHFTGIVKTIETLDYETMRRESLLYVRASDWGLPFRRQTEMELKIKLRDINDNGPRFERVNCSGALSRFAPIGSEIMSLAAIDFDSGNIISYRIVSQYPDSCFSLDLTSGILSLSCDLRYENFTTRTINTTATDGKHFADINPIHISIVNETVYRGIGFDADNFVCNETDVATRLKDILAEAAKANTEKSPDHNDVSVMPKRYGENIHAPEILNLPATVQVNESVPVGSKVMRLQAKDRDLGYNGKLVFGVTSGDKDSLFRLDPDTGILKVIGHLDYEKETEYNLNVVVFDLGRPQKSSTSYLTIVVLDNNDNPPKFQQPLASLKINENTPNGTAVFKAIANDLDSPENAQITYSILTETETFSIHPNTGVLYVNVPLDREKEDLFEIRIRATDQVAGGHSEVSLFSESVVTIHIEDANDNAPRFISNLVNIKVKEDLPVGALVAVIKAVDDDLGSKGDVTYSIKKNKVFSIDSLNGALYLTHDLDFEESQGHEVKIEACDRGVPPLCTSVVITIAVVDVNENVHAPQFESFVVSASALENQPAGTSVITVKATDDDLPGEDSRISYHITGGDGVGYFSIDDHGKCSYSSEW